MQRFFDVLFAGLALLALLPLLIPIVVVLRLTGEGELFFCQERVGKGGEVFPLIKLATMLKNSPNMGTGTVTLKGDARVLPFGQFLRATKINELPQLLNIILGHMSLVGPRPQTRRCFDAFPSELRGVIVEVQPGLSGIGSIIFRGEEDILSHHSNSVAFYDNVIAPYKGRVEAWYVNHQGLRSYFSVIFLTVWVVLFPSSGVVWRVFTELPEPPDELKGPLRYPSKTARA